jgi:hypothetical protein
MAVHERRAPDGRPGRRREQRGELEEIHARYVCEAGLTQAYYQLQRGESGDVGTDAEPVEWGAARFWVEQDNLPAGIVRLRATGLDDRSGASMELVLRAVPSTIWRYGAFGREFLHMDSNARVDSFNSTLGTYASQAVHGSGSNMYALANGDVGSNGDVGLDQNAKVWGDGTPGPGHTTSVLGNAVLTGSTTAAPLPMEMPTIVVPTYASSGNLTVNSNTTIATGNRAYGNMTREQQQDAHDQRPGEPRDPEPDAAVGLEDRRQPDERPGHVLRARRTSSSTRTRRSTPATTARRTSRSTCSATTSSTRS